MKFPLELAIFALFYLLIIILFGSEATAEPRGVQGNVEQGKSGAVGEEQPESLAKAHEGVQGSGTKNSSSAHDPNKEPLTFGKDAPTSSQSQSAANKDGSNPTPENIDVQKLSSRQSSGSQQIVNDTNPLADLFQITDPTMRAAMASVYGAYYGNDQCSRKAFCLLGNYLKDMPGRDVVFMFMGNYIPPQYSLYYEIFKVAVMYGQNCNVYVCVPDAPKDDAASAARPKDFQQQQQQSQPSAASNNQNFNSNAQQQQQINSNSFPR